ncbi:MAG: four-carbon acid sugar kinase family protein [bacterium]|nr:four-carbon acid sugar kinase family protein [bacterium]
MPFPDTQDHLARRVGVIADDLTGACDSGIEFVPWAPSVLVQVSPDSPEPAAGDRAVVVHNTQSRNLSSQDAYDTVFRTTRQVISSGAAVIFKKVDSALRGNFGAEIAAVMDAAKASVAFILPAIPEAGRETIGGVQHIDGVPIAESFYARDFEHPVCESSVLRRAESGSERKAGLIPLADVRAGRTAEIAAKLQQSGCQLIVVDAESAEDLRRAVAALAGQAQHSLFVGCQGLAKALAAHFGSSEEHQADFERLAGPMLCVCGTFHPQSRRQLQAAAESGAIVRLEVNADDMAGGRRTERSLNKVVQCFAQNLRGGKHVAVCLSCQPERLSPELCERAFRFLSELSRRVLETVPVSALFLTGGETAYSVCQALGVHTMKLHARIAPLVVASRVVGGPCDGMVIVTKGGSIGPDDLLCTICGSHSKET